MNMICNFSATQNNGRIVSSADAVRGENVSYTYDSLNRLIAAATTNTSGPTCDSIIGSAPFPDEAAYMQVYQQVKSKVCGGVTRA